MSQGSRTNNKEWAKPRIVVSRCLGFDSCRWNGASIPDPFVDALKPFVEYVTVCPEVEIGLGVPRNPIRIVSAGGEMSLVQSGTGLDVTESMRAFAEKFLGALGPVDGFILKGRSPSCGIKDTKVYPAMGQVSALGTTAGFFGKAALERFPDLAVEDEGRLNNERIWDHFLKRIFTSAAYRKIEETGSLNDLISFHSKNKFLIMSYSQKALRTLGRIVANREHKEIGALRAEYGANLRAAMSKIPRPPANINVAMHMLGYFSEELIAPEKDYFLSTLEMYREERLPLSVPVSLLRSWAIRFGQQYLLEQTFLEPYPQELLGVIPKGFARDIKR